MKELLISKKPISEFTEVEFHNYITKMRTLPPQKKKLKDEKQLKLFNIDE